MSKVRIYDMLYAHLTNPFSAKRLGARPRIGANPHDVQDLTGLRSILLADANNEAICAGINNLPSHEKSVL